MVSAATRNKSFARDCGSPLYNVIHQNVDRQGVQICIPSWLPEIRGRPSEGRTCPKIEATTAASGAEWKPTSIMEPMDLSNCVTSLIQEGFYERTVSFWNFDPLLQSAFGLSLRLKDPPWPQFQILVTRWSVANLRNSHSDENKQRFSFPAKMQSFFKDTTILESTLKKGSTILFQHF